jgi:hypothetical protein
MHRFTESTPTSLTDTDVIQVVVDGWEIECCAPPPVVGHPSTWGLRFILAGGDGRAGTSPFDREHDWLATAYYGQAVAYDGQAVKLSRHGVAACWEPAGGEAFRSGPIRLRGHLSGTVHGILPDEFPKVTGVVLRIELITEREMLDEADGPRRLVKLPGSLRLTDVQASPRWFTRPAPSVAGPEAATECHTGVLLTLAVTSPAPE